MHAAIAHSVDQMMMKTFINENIQHIYMVEDDNNISFL